MILLFNDSPNPPTRSLGIYRIATVLRNHGLEVEVIDFVSKWKFHKLMMYVKSIKNVEWYGFSTKFMEPYKISRPYLTANVGLTKNQDTGLVTKLSVDFENELLDWIQSQNKPIVLGGPNADVVRHMTDKFNIVCLGYSDNAVLAIHEHLTKQSPLVYEDYNNIKVVDADKDYAVTNLGNLETVYAETDFIEEDDVFPIEISRGCIFHCAFCEFGHLGKKPGTYIRDKESIKRDIVYRYETFKATRFLFVDDTFNDSIEKMQMIKEIREETGIPFEFWSYCRLDLLAAQPDQVDLISKIGWKEFTFGVETFNRASGRKVGKGADPEKLKKFLLDLRERFPDIRLQINIIIGLPHDTEETARETAQWFIDNSHLTKNIRFVNLSIRSTEGRKFNSKIALNPEKYGYKIIGINKKIRQQQWQTEHLDINSSRKLVEELKLKLNKEMISKYSNRNFVGLMSEETMYVENDDGVLINMLWGKVKNYIRKKLQYRGLSLTKMSNEKE